MNLRTACITALLGCAAATAFAQTPPAGAASTPLVDARQQRQEARINQGAASGALTPHETRRLHREQRAINRAESQRQGRRHRDRTGERAKLHHMQDHASRDIHRQKHDRQRAASAPQ